MECLTAEYVQSLKTLGQSGMPTIDYIFKFCVVLLTDLASLLGISYEEVNIWVFVVIWPVFTVYLIVRNFVLKRKLRDALLA